jgi:hypothetical protein
MSVSPLFAENGSENFDRGLRHKAFLKSVARSQRHLYSNANDIVKHNSQFTNLLGFIGLTEQSGPPTSCLEYKLA